MNKLQPTMMLVSSKFGIEDSFRLIPVSNECPYTEMIFDSESLTLIIIGNIKKQIFHMMARLNDDGELIKASKQRSNNKTFKEERKIIETPNEYYITNKDEIIYLIKLIAINTAEFDYMKFFEKKKKIVVPEKSKIIMP